VTTVNTDNTYQNLGLSRNLENNDMPTSKLGMEDFLNLMVTELTHQDPFKPMENSELGSQISQFATVSGIEELNASFTGLQDSLLSDQALQATGLVGRSVLAPLKGGYLSSGGTLKGIVGLESTASDVTVQVTNASGELVRSISLGTQEKGEVHFTWDGLNEDGEAVPPGQYEITAQAMVDGENLNPYTLIEAEVESVSVGAPGQPLALNLLGLGPISFNDVAEIH